MKKYIIIISLITLIVSCKSLINKDYSHLYEKESTYKIKSEAFYVPMQMVLKREHDKNTKFSHNIEAVYIESKKQP